MDLLAGPAEPVRQQPPTPAPHFVWAAGNLCWAAPLAGIVLMTFATLRAPARIEAPARAVVADANGVAVRIPRDGSGVVMGGPMLGEYMLTTRDPASLLSFTRFGSAPLKTSVLGRIYPDIRSKDTELARAMSPERLMLAKPSAVIPWGPAPDSLRATQLPVVDINSLGVPEWWFENVRIYGDLDHQPGRGVEMKAHFYAAIQNLRRDMAGVPRLPRVTVLEVSPGLDGTLRNTAVGGTQNEWLDLAEGWNAEQSVDHLRIDMERLYRDDPDVIVLSRVAALTPAECMSHPLWQPLRAVRSRRIYKRPPGMVFTTSGIVEYPLYTRWLAEVLHPGQLSAGVREQMRAAYLAETHYTVTDKDLDELLAVDANRFSANHERFEAGHDR